MILLLGSLALWIAGALPMVVPSRRGRAAATFGVVMAVAGGVISLAAAVRVLAGGAPVHGSVPWAVPFGRLALALDPLGAAFLAPIGLIGALAAVYGAGYLAAHEDTHPAAPRVAAYNLLLACMALVVTAANPLVLLFAWEGMTLASWVLVVSEHQSSTVRKAGALYLVAAHLATAALLVFFLALPGASGWSLGGTARAALPAGALFALALVGFGTKAAVVPFHVWLPDAHSAAPSHVSALMSGVMITMGFYGFARFLPLAGPPTAGTAAVLLVLGAGGAGAAIAHSIVQRDAKRVLAYSTIENAGLVLLAIGTARLASAAGHESLAALAWTAALFHLWNHTLFKSLLFLGVGAVAQATGTRDLESWGGLMRRFPLAGGLFTAGGAALAGLPPFGAFVSEWLLLVVLFSAATTMHGVARAALVLAIGLFAGTAALALAGGARLIGIGWLGVPRSPAVAAARPLRALLTMPMFALAALSLGAGLAPEAPLAALSRATATMGLTPAVRAASLAGPAARVSALIVGVGLALWLLRVALSRGRVARRAVTWDCGYARPDARMQYTGASLSAPLATSLAPVVRTRVRWSGLTGLWPDPASWQSQTLDRAITDLYRPLSTRFAGLFSRARGLQEPHVTTHLRYIVLALLVVLGLLFLPWKISP